MAIASVRFADGYRSGRFDATAKLGSRYEIDDPRLPVQSSAAWGGGYAYGFAGDLSVTDAWREVAAAQQHQEDPPVKERAYVIRGTADDIRDWRAALADVIENASEAWRRTPTGKHLAALTAAMRAPDDGGTLPAGFVSDGEAEAATGRRFHVAVQVVGIGPAELANVIDQLHQLADEYTKPQAPPADADGADAKPARSYFGREPKAAKGEPKDPAPQA